MIKIINEFVITILNVLISISENEGESNPSTCSGFFKFLQLIPTSIIINYL